MQETKVRSPSRENPLEKGMAIHSSILAWRFTDREAWWYSLWGLKESDTTERLTQTHKTKLGSKVMVFYNVIFLPVYMLHMVVSLRSKFIYGILFCEVDVINLLDDYSE